MQRQKFIVCRNSIHHRTLHLKTQNIKTSPNELNALDEPEQTEQEEDENKMQSPSSLLARLREDLVSVEDDGGRNRESNKGSLVDDKRVGEEATDGETVHQVVKPGNDIGD